MRQDEMGLYTTAVASELTGLHPQTLRLYERRGLLRPSRSQGGSRRYSRRDIDRVRRIVALTAAGVNLAGVQRILDLEDQLRSARPRGAPLRPNPYQAMRLTNISKHEEANSNGKRL